MARKDMGIRDLKRALEGVEAKVQKQLLRKSIRDAAKVVAGQIRATAPVAEGDLKGSVKVRSGKRKKNNISMVVVVEGGRDRGFVGFVEFGRKGQPANPFVRTSIADKKQDAIDVIVEGVAEAIK